MDTHELEEALAQLPSVAAVRVATNRDAVSEVHVFASTEAAPMQVLLDVQAAALSRFGVELDSQAIFVIQIGPGLAVSGSDAPERVGEVVATADANPTTRSDRLRVIRETALSAIQALLDGETVASDPHRMAESGAKTVSVAVAVATRHGDEEVSVESALSSGDDTDTAVRAALATLTEQVKGS